MYRKQFSNLQECFQSPATAQVFVIEDSKIHLLNPKLIEEARTSGIITTNGWLKYLEGYKTMMEIKKIKGEAEYSDWKIDENAQPKSMLSPLNRKKQSSSNNFERTSVNSGHFSSNSKNSKRRHTRGSVGRMMHDLMPLSSSHVNGFQ